MLVTSMIEEKVYNSTLAAIAVYYSSVPHCQSNMMKHPCLHDKSNLICNAIGECQRRCISFTQLCMEKTHIVSSGYLSGHYLTAYPLQDQQHFRNNCCKLWYKQISSHNKNDTLKYFEFSVHLSVEILICDMPQDIQ